jgi:two-component system, OmpR family, phosphate regulon sensor histidine kinase PhoR
VVFFFRASISLSLNVVKPKRSIAIQSIFTLLKKWRVYIIILVLSTALIGLVFVQSQYIKRGLNMQAQLFDQIVSEALMRSAFLIEQQEAKKFFESYSRIGSMYSNALSSGNFKESFYLNFENGIYTAVVQQNDTTYTFEADNLLHLDSLMSMSNICINLLTENTPPNTQILSEYNNIFQEMAYQYLFGSKKKTLSIDSTELHRILKYELERSGISTSFKFALLDGYSYRKILSNFDKINPTVFQDAYKSPVRLNTLSTGHGVLLVDFPKKRSFIFQSNKTLLILSFSFILLIASSFGASIYIIFRQKQLSELKTDFINNMTHELKTPVATISLAAEMLTKEKVLNDKNRIANYTEIINEENKRLGNHIEKVLQIAQLEKEEVRIKKERLDLHEILDDTIKKFQLQFEDNKATVYFNKNASRHIIWGDKIHIANMFSNLIDNALKYRRDVDLKIEVSTRNIKNEIEVTIKDNGIGMSSSNLNKIFTQFYRIPTGNIHNVKGFGLGLSYVKTIIESHGGTVDVDSELNRYTIFSVKLPLLH